MLTSEDLVNMEFISVHGFFCLYSVAVEGFMTGNLTELIEKERRDHGGITEPQGNHPPFACHFVGEDLGTRGIRNVGFMRPENRLLIVLLGGVALMLAYGRMRAQQGTPEDRFRTMSLEAEQKGLAERFKGITAKGTVQPGLFSIRSTGVSTDPVREAAEAFLNALTPEQQKKTVFPVKDDEWRKWMNQHFYIRQGVRFEEMTEAQREAAFGMMRAGLSAKGLKLTRDIMKLNETLGELNNNNFAHYGEWMYYLTVMGKPSKTEPWGWQLDGHHLIINYFVLGDQVVMTPLFVGSEPVIATSGKYKGTGILQDEQGAGLRMIRALDETQRNKAILEVSKTGNNNLTEAFKDNVVLDYAGVKAATFTQTQREELMKLIELYVSIDS
jgi:hypothetical protein